MQLSTAAIQTDWLQILFDIYTVRLQTASIYITCRYIQEFEKSLITIIQSTRLTKSVNNKADLGQVIKIQQLISHKNRKNRTSQATR